MRNRYVIANFKMHKTNKEIMSYISALLPLISDVNLKVVLALPSVSILSAIDKTRNTNLLIAGQNMNENDFGSYTGEINAEMLADLGTYAVLIGHSERRLLFGETDKVVNKKILKALKSGLVSVFCVGESLYDRKNNLTSITLQRQISKGLKSIYANELNNIIIAYEPVWAIGTGITATAGEIREALLTIRQILSEMYDEKIAKEVSIIYGGSIDENNCRDVAKVPQLNGVLVGGASLVPEKFIKIIKAFDVKLKKKVKK